MYLFVFIFTLIAILGLYTGAYSVQMAQLAARQRGFAQIMVTWHQAAYNLARTSPALIAVQPGPAGCFLTGGSVAPPFAHSTATFPPQTVAGMCPTRLWSGGAGGSGLPPGYITSNYTFYSTLYRPTTGAVVGPRYLITYVLMPTNPTAFIAQPAVGYTLGDLERQMGMLQVPTGSVGVAITGGILRVINPPVSGAASSVTDLSLPVPSSGLGIPPGSLALVSFL